MLHIIKNRFYFFHFTLKTAEKLKVVFSIENALRPAMFAYDEWCMSSLRIRLFATCAQDVVANCALNLPKLSVLSRHAPLWQA